MKKEIVLILFFVGVAWFGFAQKEVKSFDTKGIKTSIIQFASGETVTQNEKLIEKLYTELEVSKDLEFRIKNLDALSGNNYLDKRGVRYVRYSQLYNGIKIENADVVVRLKNQVVTTISGNYQQNMAINTTPTISGSASLQRAKDYIEGFGNEKTDGFLKSCSKAETELVICNNIQGNPAELDLCYKHLVFSSNYQKSVYVYVNAHNGNIMHRLSTYENFTGTADTRYSGNRNIATKQLDDGNYQLVDEGRNIYTYNTRGISTSDIINSPPFEDNNNQWTATEYHANKDDGALDAHWGLMNAYDFFLQKFGRDSYDNQHGQIKTFVHYGDGARFTTDISGGAIYVNEVIDQYDIMSSVDVISHEYGHWVTHYIRNGSPERGEPRAISEGLADIFGTAVEHFATPNKNFWLLGEDIDLSVSKENSRSMDNPNSKLMPDTFGGNYYYGTIGCAYEECGEQANCCVLDYWFYLLVEGGPGINDLGHSYNLSSIGRENAYQLVYNTMQSLTGSSDFLYFKALSLIEANELLGAVGVQKVADAWNAVGLGDCRKYVINNKTDPSVLITIPTGIIVGGTCGLDIENAKIESGKTTIQNFGGILISGEFDVKLGAELEIVNQ